MTINAVENLFEITDASSGSVHVEENLLEITNFNTGLHADVFQNLFEVTGNRTTGQKLPVATYQSFLEIVFGTKTSSNINYGMILA
jgi:hypothetical protein